MLVRFLVPLLLVVSGAANAETFTPAPNASYALDLDTKDGNYSIWSANDLTGLNALRAHVTFARKGTHERFAPSFTVVVAGATREARLAVIAAPIADRSSFMR